MSANKYPRGLPPTYPQTYRRGSNTPNTNRVVNDTQLITTNRSRSLDGLLDSTEPITQDDSKEILSTDVSSKTQSCEDILNNKDDKVEETDKNIKNDDHNHHDDDDDDNVDGDAKSVNPIKSNLENVQEINPNTSQENCFEESTNTDDRKSTSTLSLHSNSSESKRKRNFMDRCVNKMRSLIKK